MLWHHEDDDNYIPVHAERHCPSRRFAKYAPPLSTILRHPRTVSVHFSPVGRRIFYTAQGVTSIVVVTRGPRGRIGSVSLIASPWGPTSAKNPRLFSSLYQTWVLFFGLHRKPDAHRFTWTPIHGTVLLPTWNNTRHFKFPALILRLTLNIRRLGTKTFSVCQQKMWSHSLVSQQKSISYS